MELLEAIKARHSVRSYQDKPLSAEIVDKLKQEMTFAWRKRSAYAAGC